MIKLSTYTFAALALSACAMDLETPAEEETVQALGTGCPQWGCGENSPVMGPFNFWELNLAGLPNRQDIRVLDFKIGNTSYQPRMVNGSRLVAFHPPTNTSVTGAGLTNAVFRLSTPAGIFKLSIVHVNPVATSPVTFWVGPPHQIETYELRYEGPTGIQGRVCNNPPSTRDPLEAAGHTWEAPLEAILFTGDRYHAERKLVTAASYATTADWMTIGCAGSALAKLHFNRHTTAGSYAAFTSSPAMRQTLLKMYVSDVCGTGTTWTNAGTPLHWQNATGTVKLDNNEFAFESRWGAGGALCLDTHRLGDLYGDPLDPQGIYSECKPPPCNGSVTAPDFPAGTYIDSAVPIDPNLP